MALPDTDKVIQELNRRFAESLPEFYQRRIIFWHDEDRDFEEKIQSGEIELANAKLVVLDETNGELLYRRCAGSQYAEILSGSFCWIPYRGAA